MEDKKIVLLDTSILIEYYRKKDKRKTLLFQLSQTYDIFAISAVTQFEIYVGTPPEQISFWDRFFEEITVLPFNSETAVLASNIDKDLKRKRKQIDIPDLFIAATALSNDLPCATLNRKHFSRVENLHLIG